jgi:hypothetical protein
MTAFILFAGQISVSPAQAGYNSYKACYSKCTKPDLKLEKKCRAQSCGKLKGKARKRCNKLCGMKEGIFEYCKTSCAKNDSCLRSKKTKSCLGTCDKYKTTNVYKYGKCRKKCKSKCIPF